MATLRNGSKYIKSMLPVPGGVVMTVPIASPLPVCVPGVDWCCWCRCWCQRQMFCYSIQHIIIDRMTHYTTNVERMVECLRR